METLNWETSYNRYQKYKKWPLKSIKKVIRDKGNDYFFVLLSEIKQQKEYRNECKKLIKKLEKWKELRQKWFKQEQKKI